MVNGYRDPLLDDEDVYPPAEPPGFSTTRGLTGRAPHPDTPLPYESTNAAPTSLSPRRGAEHPDTYDPFSPAGPEGDEPEVAILRQLIAEARRSLSIAEQQLQTAIQADRYLPLGDPRAGVAQAQAEVAKAQISRWKDALHIYNQRYAQVVGEIRKERTKPKPLGDQEKADIEVETARRKEQAQYDIRAADRKSARELAEQRLGLDRERMTTEAQLAGERLGFDRERLTAEGQRADSSQQAQSFGSLFNATVEGQRATESGKLQKYAKELELAIRRGEMDAANADRELQRFKLATDYAKQYGLDRPWKRGYDAVAGFAGLSGQRIDPGPWKQEMVDPFKMAGFTGQQLPMRTPSIQAPAAPELTPFDPAKTVQTATSALQQVPAFNRPAAPNPPSPATPPPATPPQPASGPIAPVQPPSQPQPAQFSTFGMPDIQQQIAQWRQERMARGEDPNDMDAWRQHALRIVGGVP